MKGKVVNIRNENYDVYIGRFGKGQNGYFGNPITEGTRKEKLERYESYLLDRIEQDNEFREHVKNLHDKVLGCFCKPKPCHGDILLREAKRLQLEDDIFT